MTRQLDGNPRDTCPRCGGVKLKRSRLCKDCCRIFDADAFWARIDKGDGCWEWTGPTIKQGYGKTKCGPERQAHRVAYMLAVGPIPDGLFVCHHCDNRRCCRPDHLFVGDAFANGRDMAAKGRAGGAKFTVEIVKQMREMHTATGLPMAEVGKHFGVSKAQAHLILTYKAWKDVA